MIWFSTFWPCRNDIDIVLFNCLWFIHEINFTRYFKIYENLLYSQISIMSKNICLPSILVKLIWTGCKFGFQVKFAHAEMILWKKDESNFIFAVNTDPSNKKDCINKYHMYFQATKSAHSLKMYNVQYHYDCWKTKQLTWFKIWVSVFIICVQIPA